MGTIVPPRKRERVRRDRSPDESSRRDLEIGGVAHKMRADSSSDEESGRRSRKNRREVDSERDRGKRVEVDDATVREKRASKERTSSDEEDENHLSKVTGDVDDDYERKRSPKGRERHDRERTHRGSRVLADKPSGKEDDRQKSRRGGRESERKRRDHQASDDDEEGEIRNRRRGRERTDRGNEEIGGRDWSDRHRRDDGGRDEKERRHSDRYSDSQTDKLRKEEKSEAAKPSCQSSTHLTAMLWLWGKLAEFISLPRMMKEVEDKSSVEYQRLTWDALRKSINGLVNKVNAKPHQRKGLSAVHSQMASPGFTDVFAALVAVINAKFPELKRAYKRNDKPQLLAAVKFIAHLVNQQVAEEIIALELVTVLLENPTDDSVEVAVGFVTECGAMLQDVTPKGLHGIFERFRGILHEGEIDKRVQYLIEGLFAIRKAKFQGHPAVRPELDLVEEKYSHDISIDDEINPETSLDVFKPDPDFLENEKKYEVLKKELLGEDESDDEDGSDASSEDNDDEEDDSDEEEDEEQMRIRDETETNLVNLRRTIYLTIMSSVDFEEAGHKQEMELCIMLLECCSQERERTCVTTVLLGQRFCMINKIHQENFEKCFVQQYSMIHRLETNKLRNVAKFFAHLLGTDALPWHVLAYIRLTEEDTTSSSHPFQELSEHLGIRLLNERLQDPTMQESLESIFPKDNPKNTRFAINFFTSIGLGGITENLREYLKNMPRLIMQQQKQVAESTSSSGSDSSGSESDSSTSSSSSSSSSDESDREKRKRRRRS
ncbi:LOW QUALITY PROTEIN: hypothetical protein HID58_094629 [Brassica napus]|uniref:MI domain-containing protein n=1 Tax=Brassica napus TaxID=3708 RepID=A0ABQ7X6M0_BRANA|nr:LOW QUALITY PROTEIN: hypothetical protein HID58_094629 [Brassica napus]